MKAAAPKAAPKACVDCDGELQRKEIVGSSKRLDKAGRCPVCAEVDAEAKADDEEALRRAEQIKARRAVRSAELQARLVELEAADASDPTSVEHEEWKALKSQQERSS